MRHHTNTGIVLAILPAMTAIAFAACSGTRASRDEAAGAQANEAVREYTGRRTGSTARAAIYGAVYGGPVGSRINVYMDAQAAELDDRLQGAKVERVAEGIRITLPAATLFGVNSADLRQPARSMAQTLANTLKRYDNTDVLVLGHTDGRGSRELNQRLSERRAAAVGDFLVRLGLASNRVERIGRGEIWPVTTNATDEGRRRNRRVEIAIIANTTLADAARRGDLASMIPADSPDEENVARAASRSR